MKAEILKEAVEENFTELGKDLGLYHKGAFNSQAEWMATWLAIWVLEFAVSVHFILICLK